MEIKPIAFIHTPFPEKFGIPRQSGLVAEAEGTVTFVSDYRSADAVRGLEEFSHLWLLWGFSESIREGFCATVAPPRLGGRERKGVFATRSPFRPNPIGLSCVKLESVTLDEKLGPVITVSGVDMLDGTPIYDIKPYLPYTDNRNEASGGFGSRMLEHRLQVSFPEELIEKIRPEDRETVCELLAQDPRTAFIHDENRVWGLAYRDYNLRFTVKDNSLTVKEVEFISLNKRKPNYKREQEHNDE